jgi:Flp pilus assembly protein TadG
MVLVVGAGAGLGWFMRDGLARRIAMRLSLRRFRRDDSGATAIEFTILAIPFMLLVFAVIESCVSFAGQQLLSNVTDEVARQLRTGQLRKEDVNENSLKQLICKDLELMVAAGCPELEVDLQHFDSFEQAAKVRIKLTAAGDIDTSGFKVDPGPAMSKNMLRVFYRWPVMTDFMRKAMSNLNGGKTLQFATATWQNEPFDDTDVTAE